MTGEALQARGEWGGEVLERTLRTSPVTGIRVDSVLTAVLLAELLKPSSEIWLVSAWISDVPRGRQHARRLRQPVR